MAINTEKVSVLFISALWIIMVAAVNPIGEFPLNDDWAYAASVRTLLEDNRFVFPDWSAPNFVAQAIWGWLFCSIFGFSFTVLRFSVLILGLVGVIAAFKLSRETGAPTGAAVLGALVLVVNPIYFTSSNTFMTDVPFFAFSALSLIFLTRAVNNDKASDIALGAVVVSLALLTRQLAFAIPLAYAAAYLAGRELSRKTIFRALFPLVVCIILQLLFQSWILKNGQIPTMYGHQIDQIKIVLSLPILDIARIYGSHILNASLYLGLFVSPVLLLGFFHRNEKNILTQIPMAGLRALLVWEILRVLGIPRWPLLENIMGEYGIGPSLNHGSASYWVVPQYQVSIFWELIGVLSVAFTGLMIFSLLSSLRKAWLAYKNKDLAHVRMLVLFGGVTLIYFIPVVGVDRLIDRYLLLPILTVTQILFLFSNTQTVCNLTNIRVAIIALVTISVGILTVAATHDYLAWNRVRWTALNYLVHEKGVPPTKIDGGFEFNGMYLYSKDKIKPDSKGWWVVDNEYLITYTTEYLAWSEGYKVEARYLVHPYLSVSPSNIFVLHRQ